LSYIVKRGGVRASWGGGGNEMKNAKRKKELRVDSLYLAQTCGPSQ